MLPGSLPSCIQIRKSPSVNDVKLEYTLTVIGSPISTFRGETSGIDKTGSPP